MLADFGENGVLSRITDGAYDPDTGSVTRTTVEHTVKIVVVQFRKGETETGLVTKDDRKAYLEVKDGAVPQDQDTIRFAGSTLKVSRVVSVMHGSSGSLIYILAVRG